MVNSFLFKLEQRTAMLTLINPTKAALPQAVRCGIRVFSTERKD
jgi:hypothetical protein